METISDFKCPCHPECENYGHCKECILAHAKYYSVPFCIRKMQKEMKEKHLHVIVPHQKETLTERIEKFYDEHPSEHLRTVAEGLKVTDCQLLEAHPDAEEIPVADFRKIYDTLASLDKVLLHLDSGSVVLQLETPLPSVMDMRGTLILKQTDGAMSMTSLLFPSGFYKMFLVRESLYAKESLSVAIVGDDEKTAISIYMRRGKDDMIDPTSKQAFEKLWTEYGSNL